MTTNRPRTVPFRRKREGKTDYQRRLNVLKGRKPRLVVRRSNKHIVAQIVEYRPEGDRVIASATSREVQKSVPELTTINLPTAYLVGKLVGKKAQDAKVKEALLDIGLHAKGERLFAVLKGAVDAGLEVPHNENSLPSDERLQGKHIEDHRNVKMASLLEKAEKSLGV